MSQQAMSQQAMSRRTVILKLGGSVLTMPDLSLRLSRILEFLKPDPVLLIIGGGASADLLRELDHRHGYLPEKAHWDAIATMTSNSLLLSRLNPALSLVTNRDEALRMHTAGLTAVLDAVSYLRNEECLDAKNSLPATWDVTSDSIALWTAVRWPASRLILGKSCNPASVSVTELVNKGQIDRWFTHIQATCPIEWLNIRSGHSELIPLHVDSSPESTIGPELKSFHQ